MDHRFTVPNVLTVARIAMSAAAAWLIAGAGPEALALGLLVGGALLDVFDGWYARVFGQASALGKHLDPFADKVLAGVMYGWIGLDAGSAVVWVAIALVIAREVALTAFRSYSLRRHGRFIPAGPLGKLKTFLQCSTGMTILGFTHWLGRPVPEPLVLGAISIALLASYASAAVYLRDWRRDARRAVPAAGERAGRVASGG